MQTVEFIADLTSEPILKIPGDVAEQLPKVGQARVIVVTGDDAEDGEWRRGAYEQFMRDDSPEDSVYDSY